MSTYNRYYPLNTNSAKQSSSTAANTSSLYKPTSTIGSLISNQNSTIGNTHQNAVVLNRYDKYGSMNNITPATTTTTSNVVRPRPLPSTSKNTTFDGAGATTRITTTRYYPQNYSSTLLPDINKPKIRTTTTTPTSMTPIITTTTAAALNNRTRSPSVGPSTVVYQQQQQSQTQQQYDQFARIQSPPTNNIRLVKQFNDLNIESNSNAYNTSAYNNIKPNAIYEHSSLSDNNIDYDDNEHNQLYTNGNVGLKNLGNTKYVNDLNVTLSRMKGSLFKAYAQLVISMWSKQDSVVSPQDFRSKITFYAPRFGGYNQQDAQEFLRYLLLGLHEDVNLIVTKPKPIKYDEQLEERMSENEKSEYYWQNYLSFDRSKIVDIFVGQLKSVLTCTHCDYKSVTFDPFWDLSLPMPTTSAHTAVTLFDCIKLFMTEEILDGNEKPTCARCKQRRKCTKRFYIQRLPTYLVLHLKRFSPEQRRKLETNVQFPINDLDLKNYLSETAEKHLSTSYDLYGVSYHIGSLSSGHYNASCKHPFSKKWFHYNDSYVSEISQNAIQSSQAYVLFYERVK